MNFAASEQVTLQRAASWLISIAASHSWHARDASLNIPPAARHACEALDVIFASDKSAADLLTREHVAAILQAHEAAPETAEHACRAAGRMFRLAPEAEQLRLKEGTSLAQDAQSRCEHFASLSSVPHILQPN